MKNIKIKTKLYGLVAFTLVALILNSVFSITLITSLNDSSLLVSDDCLPSITLVEEIRINIAEYRITEANHIIAETNENMDYFEANLKSYSVKVSSMFFDYYTNYASNEEDISLVESVGELWSHYVELNTQILAVSRTNDTVGAREIFRSESLDTYMQMSRELEQLINFNNKLAEQAVVSVHESYDETLIGIVLVTLLVSIVGAYCSIVILNGIIRPVNEMVDASQRMLNGDLLVNISHRSEDELGRLSSSMRHLCSMINESIKDMIYVLEAMADGDYTIRTKKEHLYIGDLKPLQTTTDSIAKKLSESFSKINQRDSLTGLSNRTGYSNAVDEIMNNPPKSLGVISVNINGLKVINEKQGMRYGDQHIIDSVNKLKDHFGYEFFRMSGVEFLAIAPDADCNEFESNVNAMHKIMHDNDDFGFSMGHAWETGNYEVWKIIKTADTVMYINKQDYYTASGRDISTIDDELLANLLSHLENEEFMVYFQPQVKLKDGSLYGAEALIRRFDKSNQKMVFPDQFISLYEQRSIIRHVDMFVVDKVCAYIAEWLSKGNTVPISVNLSRVTLLEFGIVDTIVEICDKHKIPHNLLVIEVTERVGLIENNVASSLVKDFKSNGFNISLDDFGCAYSNIVTLAQIDVDEVKIDKSLVDDLTTNVKNHVLVKNVLTMCNELENTSTLAEGIENEEQANLLRDLNCHLGQGYFYSRPIPADEFVEKYITPLNNQADSEE